MNSHIHRLQKFGELDRYLHHFATIQCQKAHEILGISQHSKFYWDGSNKNWLWLKGNLLQETEVLIKCKRKMKQNKSQEPLLDSAIKMTQACHCQPCLPCSWGRESVKSVNNYTSVVRPRTGIGIQDGHGSWCQLLCFNSCQRRGVSLWASPTDSYRFRRWALWPWPGGSVLWSIILYIKRLKVRSPVRAHT